MTSRRFADWDFDLVGAIEPERDQNGRVLEFMPQSRYQKAATTPLNSSGKGPFCRFRIAQKWHQSGLYVLTLDGEPVYAGECANLAVRWGPTQYGSISPKNCFKGGQSTNCRINAAILAIAKEGRKAELWFVSLEADVGGRRAAETRLIQCIRPAWNRAKLS